MPDTHYDVKNIITNSAFLFQGAVGAAVPVMPPTDNNINDIVTTLSTGMVWTPIGYTDAGIKFGYDPTYKDITVDELLAPVDSLLTAEKLTISCAIAELTVYNLSRLISTAVAPTVVASGVGTAGITTFKHGGNQTTNKNAYLLVSNGPQGFPRFLHVFQATATSKLDATFKRGEKIMTPIEITSLAYSTNPTGQNLFEIIDKTANGS
jgi:hypothetical protein